MTLRRLGTLTVADLGAQVTGPSATGAQIRGTITSIRHFLFIRETAPNETHTSVMVKVPVAAPREPDHREILQLSAVEVDVAGPARDAQ